MVGYVSSVYCLVSGASCPYILGQLSYTASTYPSASTNAQLRVACLLLHYPTPLYVHTSLHPCDLDISYYTPCCTSTPSLSDSANLRLRLPTIYSYLTPTTFYRINSTLCFTYCKYFSTQPAPYLSKLTNSRYR